VDRNAAILRGAVVDELLRLRRRSLRDSKRAGLFVPPLSPEPVVAAQRLSGGVRQGHDEVVPGQSVGAGQQPDHQLDARRLGDLSRRQHHAAAIAEVRGEILGPREQLQRADGGGGVADAAHFRHLAKTELDSPAMLSDIGRPEPTA
jgi:hypothetical protein